MFQDYALFPHMNVEQNVGYGMWIARRCRRRRSLPHVSKPCGWSACRTRPRRGRPSFPAARSSVSHLARAIIRRPKVLLLDEPLSALDAKLREAMQVELRHLHQKLGITFLLVTHDQTEAMVMSDRILIMEKGRVVQDGTPPELYERPASPYVANFLGTSNLLRAIVSGHDEGSLSVEAGPATLQIAQPGAPLRDGRQGDARDPAGEIGIAAELGAAIEISATVVRQDHRASVPGRYSAHQRRYWRSMRRFSSTPSFHRRARCKDCRRPAARLRSASMRQASSSFPAGPGT